MATQVKLLKDLSLIGVAALVITLALPLSVIGEEVITLTTIMPGQDTLRVRRGVVGVDWRPTDVLTNLEIGDNNLLIQGNVGIGTTGPRMKLDVSTFYSRDPSTPLTHESQGAGIFLGELGTYVGHGIFSGGNDTGDAAITFTRDGYKARTIDFYTSDVVSDGALIFGTTYEE